MNRRLSMRHLLGKRQLDFRFWILKIEKKHTLSHGESGQGISMWWCKHVTVSHDHEVSEISTRFNLQQKQWTLPRVVSLKMDALISLMNHPYLTMKLASDDDSTRRIEAVYPLSLFFAFGIYLVFQRYQIRYNAAVPFDFPSPDVCLLTSFA